MAIDVAVEEVAENLEELAEATRSINTTAVGYFIGGVFIGLGMGFYFGYRFNREKIKAEAFKQSEEEIEKIRETYQQKATVAKLKPSVESIVVEKGYGSPVTPTPQRPLPAPVPISDTEAMSWAPDEEEVEDRGEIYTGVIPDADADGEIWIQSDEEAMRSPTRPYVIHQNEFTSDEHGFKQVQFTYYAIDDVLTGEDDRPLPDAAGIVGKENLRWGHGTDDIDTVFVRNEKLELEMEISRIPASYEQEVLGMNRDEEN